MGIDVILNLGLKRGGIAVDEGIHNTLERKSGVTCPGVEVCLESERFSKQMGGSQLGFVLSGEATTIPELAPEAQAPAEPILHSRSCTTGVSSRPGI